MFAFSYFPFYSTLISVFRMFIFAVSSKMKSVWWTWKTTHSFPFVFKELFIWLFVPPSIFFYLVLPRMSEEAGVSQRRFATPVPINELAPRPRHQVFHGHVITAYTIVFAWLPGFTGFTSVVSTQTWFIIAFFSRVFLYFIRDFHRTSLEQQ